MRIRLSSDEKKREGRSGRRAEDFQEFTAAKETTTLKLWKKSRKGWLGNLPFHKSVLEESNLKRCMVPGKIGNVTIVLKKGRGGGKIKRKEEGDKNGHGKSKVSILWE